ncbi:transporter substrate-binding domain-containing protein [Rhodoferax ferrireducens]|uniref:transporter substrate-binding domain-containing protein n=1 Tax=Rhodoferax ferrireducens TaxID=192843 RepID=UPI000E0CEF05|nr:transporter substrate-binding domain-containing protein [Rhodoferax ferrireducens]
MRFAKLAFLVGTFITVSATQASAQELTGTMKKIKETGTITLGHRESSVPFAYYDDKQQPVGYSMDLCNKVVDAVKAELKIPNLQVKLQPVNSSNRIPLVKNGAVDLECGSTANYIKRQEEVGFSVSTFWVAKKFIAKTGSGLKTIDDLKGKAVVVTQGTDTATLIRTINDERKLGLVLMSGKDHAESLLTVESGRAMAFMEDDVLVAGLRANARDPLALVLLQDSFGGDPYALMMRKDDPQFKKIIDSTLTKLMASGEIKNIYAKWFQGPIAPNGVNIGYPMPEGLKTLIKTPSDHAAH